MKYQVTSYSFRGGRAANQDRVAVAERSNAVLMAVADGLGGHSGGEIAAEILTQTAVRAFTSVRQPLITRPSAFLALAILQAHNFLSQRSRNQPAHLQPRTTCVLCLVQDGYAYWAHVGDSRLYHFRDGKLLGRTQDHTSIEQFHQEGLLTDAEMSEHPSKGRLLKCVGGPNTPTIALGQETILHQGDVLMLCSDGVWEALGSAEITRYMAHKDLDEGAEEMLRAAHRERGDHCDNITVAALRWEDVMTAALPQQGNGVEQVDPRRLWEDGTKLSADTKLQRTAPAEAPVSAQSLDEQIRDIEIYMKKMKQKK